MDIEILNKSHSSLIEKFSCIEDDIYLKSVGFNSNKRRKIRKHSNDIDGFLKEESLLEQEQGLNTTHLFIDNNSLIGFISICNDSIPLEIGEKNLEKVIYENVPSLKIARLGIDNRFKGNGHGTELIQFAVFVTLKIRNLSGIKFITVDCYEHRLSFYKKFGFRKNKIQLSKKEYDKPMSLRLNIDEYVHKLEI